MKVKKNDTLFIMSILIYLLSIILACYNLNELSIIISIIASAVTILYTKIKFNCYSSLALIFVCFSCFYGLSGPIAVYLGDGISEIFGFVYELKSYIISYSLSEIALMLSFLLMTKNKVKQNTEGNISKKKANYLKNISVILLVIGTFFQIINIIRVGGISVLLKGKAYYQAAEAALTLTLPAEFIMLLSFTTYAVYISYQKKFSKINIKAVIVYFIAAIPYLLTITILGQRGKLVALMLVSFLGFFSFSSLKKLSKNIILVGIFCYLFMGFVYANRATISYLKTDPNFFWTNAFKKEKMIKALNPGTNEFGCTYGNYNTYIIYGNSELLLGKSYINSFALLIPSFIYPGEKPTQITYIFRDNFFPSEGKRSSIAGTAFSSVLEAYWNFGYIGVFVLYLFYGIFISKLEIVTSNKGFFGKIIYVYISTFAMNFHRSSFGDMASGIIYKLCIAIVFVLIPYLIINNTLSKNNKI